MILQPFLARAEKEKLAYEAARRLYEQGTVGFETTINFGNADETPGPSSVTFPSYSPSSERIGTTFVFGPPAHGAGISSDSEPDVDTEMEMDSDASTTDEERIGSRRMNRL